MALSINNGFTKSLTRCAVFLPTRFLVLMNFFTKVMPQDKLLKQWYVY